MNRIICFLAGHEWNWTSSVNEKYPSGFKCRRCGKRKP